MRVCFQDLLQQKSLFVVEVGVKSEVAGEDLLLAEEWVLLGVKWELACEEFMEQDT